MRCIMDNVLASSICPNRWIELSFFSFHSTAQFRHCTPPVWYIHIYVIHMYNVYRFKWQRILFKNFSFSTFRIVCCRFWSICTHTQPNKQHNNTNRSIGINFGFSFRLHKPNCCDCVNVKFNQEWKSVLNNNEPNFQWYRYSSLRNLTQTYRMCWITDSFILRRHV